MASTAQAVHILDKFMPVLSLFTVYNLKNRRANKKTYTCYHVCTNLSAW